MKETDLKLLCVLLMNQIYNDITAKAIWSKKENRFNNKFALKITALLLQEKIRRSFL